MTRSVLFFLALAASCSRGGPVLDSSADIDGDGILDVHEGLDDADGDGLPNAGDDDSDGDGFSDALERGDDDPLTLPVDTDGDRIPDFLDLDSDGNGLPDGRERYRDQPRPDLDEDGLLDPHDLDDDGDGVPDTLEGAGELLDTDGDGDPDRVDLDSDGDGILDADEGVPLRQGVAYDHDQDGVPDLRDLDSDDDGLTDAGERGDGWRPRDTDGDGRGDWRDRDSDNDGLADDVDHRTADERSIDADGDGFRDGVEVQLGSDPRDAASVPGAPMYEVRPRIDVEEQRRLSVDVGRRTVDVYFLLSIAHAERVVGREVLRKSDVVRRVLQGLLPLLLEQDADIAVGLGLYGARSWELLAPYHDAGRSTQPAFRPMAVPGRTLAPIEAALDTWGAIPDSWPDDGGLLALDQAMSGSGYDANCDGHFQPWADVRPWTATSNDLFGGEVPGFAASLEWPPGRLPGFGRRPFAMPMILLEPEGFSDPGGTLGSRWGWSSCSGCEEPTSNEVASRLGDLGGRVVLYDVENRWSTERTADYIRDVLDVFDAYADLDGDGVRDDPLIVHGDLLDAEAALDNLTDDLLRIIQHAIASRDFERVDFTVAGDELGFVQSFDPPTVDVPEEGTGEVAVTLTFRGVAPPKPTDQVFALELVAAGDGVVSLGSQPFYVVVPGTGLD